MKNRTLSILLILSFFWSFNSSAQKGVIINDGAKVELNNGAVLVIGDDLGLINHSAETVFNGEVIFSGTGLQEIGGSAESLFSYLEIDNINGVYLANTIRVTTLGAPRSGRQD